MKYNEAIDMILDGGEAFMRDDVLYRYSFDSDGFLVMNQQGEEYKTKPPVLGKYHIKQDWIVEKDGVVYEEYPEKPKKLPADIFKTYKENLICPWCSSNQMIKLGDTLKHACVCRTCGKMCHIINAYVKDSTHEQNEPAELEECGEPWERIKMPIIAEEVNEDWLEKKMLCFLTRHIQTDPFDKLAMYYRERKDCGSRECEFCFPPDHIAGVGNMVEEKACSICGDVEKLKTCSYRIDGIIYCQDCKKNNPELDGKFPESREKVTVKTMEQMLDNLIGQT